MDTLIRKIANTIVANLQNTSTLGLFNGEVGIALFLYQYARFSKQNLYEEVADELVEDVYAKINKGMGSDLKNGFSGIGLGIKYLIDEKLLEGEIDEILSEIDETLLENAAKVFRNELAMPNPVFSTGIYLHARLSGHSVTDRDKRWMSLCYEAGISLVEEKMADTQWKPQLSLLNSMLFAYVTFYNGEIGEPEKTSSFFNVLLTLSAKAVEANCFENNDLYLFLQVYSRLPDCMKAQYQPLEEQINGIAQTITWDMELWNNLLWWTFIYGCSSPVPEESIELYTEQLLDNYPFELGNINGQLASLGLFLMKRI